MASSSSSIQVSNQLCDCNLPVRKPNAKKKCELWDWFDEELKPDWYILQLNPNERHFLQNEMNREQRIRHLQQDVYHGLSCLLKLMKQLIIHMAQSRGISGSTPPTAADVPTLLGTGAFSLLGCKSFLYCFIVSPLLHMLDSSCYLDADQVRGIGLREIGGGFPKHHRAPSIKFACYAIAKPSTMVQKMQDIKKLRGHRDAVYCAIFDRSGRYVITGSDDRLVKIWSMETAFCLASCRGHEGDITDLAVNLNNSLVASASNDYNIRVWRLPDGYPLSVLRGHIGAVTAIAFSPKYPFQLLSSSDDGTCRIWEARSSQCPARVFVPRRTGDVAGSNNGPSTSTIPPNNQILCCAYNANGTIFVTGSSNTFARVWSALKSNTDDSQQPTHEIDVLAGHENDVNYVQFSGCAVASRSSTLDSSTDEKVPKLKTSWYNYYDNIVTCSRDGSAIIWITKSRKSHGKAGRWIRAYHLKVPPPPMPPQPRRGGPRQRFLPTPRGVYMIVWSLDNILCLLQSWVLQICVWNASDGRLVHSLTGHSESTYVLDVHPFNPRIAMSSGYDGKTIIWDDLIRSLNMRTKDVVKFPLWWSFDDLDYNDSSEDEKRTLKNISCDDVERTSSRTKRIKKSRNNRNNSKETPSRPQRAAARNGKKLASDKSEDFDEHDDDVSAESSSEESHILMRMSHSFSRIFSVLQKKTNTQNTPTRVKVEEESARPVSENPIEKSTTNGHKSTKIRFKPNVKLEHDVKPVGECSQTKTEAGDVTSQKKTTIKFKIKSAHAETSRNVQNDDNIKEDDSSDDATLRARSLKFVAGSRETKDAHQNKNKSVHTFPFNISTTSAAGSKSDGQLGKTSWLLLSQQDESCRYIPSAW
ncbi:PH-interacting protein-like isoform X1 [Tanacetum coccineum]|uniref:PH-interacting protein-like isoform X1 n=1 Tax=Tanacetum coccineum TaxID=301880 RepID=A0ABQ5CYT2_9ASTR